MAVPYTAGPDSFQPGKPHIWSDVRISQVRSARNFDVMPDGKHILALVPPLNETKSIRATVLLNFYDEVARKVKAAESGSAQ